MSSIRQKIVVITGSTRGIGFGLAGAFLERGCAVVVSGRNREGVDEALARLSGRGATGNLLGLPCDVSLPDQVQALWDEASDRFGQVDIWINNAGLANHLADIRLLSPDLIAAVVNANVLGTLYGSRVALNGMLAQGFGAIYNMEGHGSNGRIQDGLTLYGTTKAAIKYFNDCLFKEAQEGPVIVGALRPGMVWTDMVQDQFKEQPEAWEQSKAILNIIMDRVETVAPWLADQILANDKNGLRISWFNRRKMIGRFLSAPFHKRQIAE